MKIHWFHFFKVVGFLILVNHSIGILHAQTQQLIGNVVDSSLSEPVPFATVVVNENFGTISDELGVFQIPLDILTPNDTLHISSIGYAGINIPVSKLELNKPNTIFLNPNIYELNTVVVKGKKRRIPRSKKIIEAVIENLANNFNTDTIVYQGYYREYVKEKNNYLNLFESILQVQEYLNDSTSDYDVNVLYKRQNKDFRIDPSLITSYDNRSKYVPLSQVRVFNNNEFVQLRLIDPVMNIRGKSVSYLDEFRVDFIENHTFEKPKLTYLNNEPYYLVSFKDLKNYVQGTSKISMSGSIYIDAEDYGIKKITYLAMLNQATINQKLFELSIEYKKVDNKYFLHYISFNNLFKNQGFTVANVSVEDGGLAFLFTRNIDKNKIGLQNTISVKYNQEKQTIDSILIQKNRLLLKFDDNGPLNHQFKKLEKLQRTSDNSKSNEFIQNIFQDLDVQLTGVFDAYGNPLSNKKFTEYYQYREYFVNDIKTNYKIDSAFIMDKMHPVIQAETPPIDHNLDTNWLNTPLIEEELANNTQLTDFKVYSNYINQHSEYDDNHRKELVYVHTDREVYAPEDTIWFKGYIRQDKFLSRSYLSQQFFIQLADSTGDILWNDKFIITDGDATGQIPVSMDQEEGYYYLSAYSSWNMNFAHDNMYTKKILIQKEKRNEIKMRVAYDKNTYYPGDTLIMTLSCVDEYNTKLNNVHYKYAVNDNKKEIVKGTGVTNDSVINEIKIVLPLHLTAIPKISIHSTYDFEGYDVEYKMPVNYFAEIGFYPEGGHLISGIESKIAFKATSRYGLPVSFKGEIINTKNEVISNVSTQHDGMGVFNYLPKTGDTCFLKIIQPAGINKQYLLPQPVDSGYHLSIQQRLGKTFASVRNQKMKNDTVLLTIMVRDKLVYFTPILVKKRKNIQLPVDELPEGIAVVTLFDEQLKPHAERLIFIQHPSQTKIYLSTDKKVYTPRDSVVLELKFESPELFRPGSYSLSVVDNQLCTSDLINEPNILAHLLLSSEIKGYINNPNYYFNPENDKASDYLDLLLLTQGWRDYKTHLTNVLNKSDIRLMNPDWITGKLVKEPIGLLQRPAPGTLNIFYAGRSEKIRVGENGEFSFQATYSYQYNSGLFLSAKDKNDRTQISIRLDKYPFQKQLGNYTQKLTDSLNKFSAPPVLTFNRFNENFSYDLEYHQWIDEVVMRKSRRPDVFSRSDLTITSLKASKLDLQDAGNLDQLWYYVDPIGYNPEGNPFYCIDGVLQYDNVFGSLVKIPKNDFVRSIIPDHIKEYKIVKGDDVEAIYGFGVRYVIDIKLKPFNERSSNMIWENPIAIQRFATPKAFYQPRYDTEQKRISQIPDLRKTILWKPNITFNENGIARIVYYNGDRYTRIKCIFEGITDTGKPVYSEHMYEVDIRTSGE